jgi:hypothetical protein
MNPLHLRTVRREEIFFYSSNYEQTVPILFSLQEPGRTSKTTGVRVLGSTVVVEAIGATVDRLEMLVILAVIGC